MKCIIKAMNETEYKPRPKWWGFVDEKGNRFLCRYNHVFAMFSQTEVIWYDYETKTDKAGVLFAIKYFESLLIIKSQCYMNYIIK